MKPPNTGKINSLSSTSMEKTPSLERPNPGARRLRKSITQPSLKHNIYRNFSLTMKQDDKK